MMMIITFATRRSGGRRRRGGRRRNIVWRRKTPGRLLPRYRHRCGGSSGRGSDVVVACAAIDAAGSDMTDKVRRGNFLQAVFTRNFPGRWIIGVGNCRRRRSSSSCYSATHRRRSCRRRSTTARQLRVQQRKPFKRVETR